MTARTERRLSEKRKTVTQNIIVQAIKFVNVFITLEIIFKV